MNRLAITLLCIFQTACTHQNEVPLHQNSVPHFTKTEVNPTQELVWPNKPGVTRLKDGQATWQENDCDKKVLPFLVIKRQDFSNSVLQANQEFKHRFLYVVCTSDSSKSIKGKLIRKILFSLLPAKSLHFLTRICPSSSSGKGWQDIKFCCMNTCCGCGSAQFGQVTTIGARHALDHAKYMQAFNLA